MSEILDLLRRRLLFIVVCAVVAVSIPVALATTSPDSYRATARLFVATSAQDVTSANQGNLAAQSRIRTYALMAVGPELLARAAQRSGVSIDGRQLAQRISVSTPPETVLLDIAATAPSAQEAATLSDAVAQELVTLVSQAERPLRGGNPSLGLLILQPADAGTVKVPVLQPVRLAIFGVAGLVLGAVIAILVPGRLRLRGRPTRASAPVVDDAAGVGPDSSAGATIADDTPEQHAPKEEPTNSGATHRPGMSHGTEPFDHGPHQPDPYPMPGFSDSTVTAPNHLQRRPHRVIVDDDRAAPSRRHRRDDAAWQFSPTPRRERGVGDDHVRRPGETTLDRDDFDVARHRVNGTIRSNGHPPL
ncbi:YveK family protein [Williamsia sp. MIQD14]|uniref:YveK family protein n=1 Tax=Williamsia sp. MIQD14 TaxID=3425703 RepID=UPI003DA0997E